MPAMEAGPLINGIVGLATVGSIIYLVIVVITPVAQTVKKLCDNVEELYTGRNDHEKRLVKTEMIHHLKGCDLPRLPIKGVINETDN